MDAGLSEKALGSRSTFGRDTLAYFGSVQSGLFEGEAPSTFLVGASRPIFFRGIPVYFRSGHTPVYFRPERTHILQPNLEHRCRRRRPVPRRFRRAPTGFRQPRRFRRAPIGFRQPSPARQPLEVCVPLQGEGGGGADQAGEVGTGVAMGGGGQSSGAEGCGGVWGKAAPFSEPRRVNVQNLLTAIRVWSVDAHVNLHPPRPQQGRVDELGSVSHTDDQHVVQRLHAVHLGQELIHD
mmetsp:Transcript_29857/g.96366  ORF Transcript_29857/g.96366 Transcript_29857/m.96366 type:complete len:237 (+) Transcript_29857:195-905(+)